MIEARVTGRFNYLCYGEYYQVLFVPFRSDICTIVARNLTREDAIELMEELNESMEETKKMLEKADEDREQRYVKSRESRDKLERTE